MLSMEVAKLFATLGLKVDKKQWDEADKKIDGAKLALGGLVTYFGAKFLGKSLVGFNAGVEDAKNGIAGMLALSKKTNLSDELGHADELYANLQRRAATLPGTTQDYVQMLGALTQPLTSAGVGLQGLEDLSVNAVVAAKALGVQWDVAARDIDQALRGQYHSVDVFTGKLLSSMGYAGEAGRQKFNAMTQAQRVAAVQAALTQKQITQLAEAQGKTFSGRLSTIQDAAEQFLGRIGKSLFESLGGVMERFAGWLSANKEEIAAVADEIGGALAGAFAALGIVVEWLIDHGDVLTAILITVGAVLAGVAAEAVIAWLAVAGPVLLVVAAVAALTYAVIKVVRDLRSGSSKIVKALDAAWDGIKGGASAVWEFLKGMARGIVDAFVSVGKAIASPFVEAFDFILGAARSTINWIMDKIHWIENKLDSLVHGTREDRADIANKFGFEGDLRERFINGDAGPPSRPGGAGTGPISVAPANVQLHMTVNGGDPDEIEKHVRQGIGTWWETQLADVEDAT